MGTLMMNQMKDWMPQQSKHRKWLTLVTALAAIVVFVTVYTLILPALTMERGDPICGKEEHTHTAECYERHLICTLRTIDDEKPPLAQVLLDGPSVEAPETAETVAETEPTAAPDQTQAESQTEAEATAETTAAETTAAETTAAETTATETESNHIHSESCYETVLVCGKEEHVHTDACYPVTDKSLDTEDRARIESLVQRMAALPKHEEFLDSMTKAAKADASDFVKEFNDVAYRTYDIKKNYDSLESNLKEFLRANHADAVDNYSQLLDIISKKGMVKEFAYCGKAQHHHKDTCFQQVRVCEDTYKNAGCSLTVHKHNETCYDQRKVKSKKDMTEENLICPYADFVVHTHDAACYDGQGNLICKLPEIREHQHTDACYDKNGKLTCKEKEIILHEHTIDCYEPGEDGNLYLACGMVEVTAHQHNAACFEKAEKSKDDGAVHKHTDNCFVTVAVGAPEHTHSLACFVEPDEEDANAADKTGASETGAMTSDSNSSNAASDSGKKDGETDKTDKSDKDGKAKADGSKAAAQSSSDSDNKRGTVYYMQEPKEDEDSAVKGIEKYYKDDKVSVTACYDEAAEIPSDAELRVKQVTAQSDPVRYEQRMEEAMNLSDSQGSQMLLYNIGFFVNGKEVTPKTPVTLKVQFLDENGEPLNGPVKVIHFAEEGTEIVEDASTDSNGVTSFLTSNESESENSSEQDNADGAGNVAQN